MSEYSLSIIWNTGNQNDTNGYNKKIEAMPNKYDNYELP